MCGGDGVWPLHQRLFYFIFSFFIGKGIQCNVIQGLYRDPLLQNA